ncbi:MAG: chemotaxis protein CheB, partial [Caldimonas sp.]
MDDRQPVLSKDTQGSETDASVVPDGEDSLTLVGIGGSAGSIPAMQTFFRTLPPDTGMAFVVILHLAPDHGSELAELIQRVTTMPVVQVRDTERTAPNRVYVIPPGRSLLATRMDLRLGDLPPAQGRHVAIDLFFRTLGDTHGRHAVAVILSGADSDGAMGIRRIKECGGLTIAQDPAEAEHGTMPGAAIDTGLVDWVLPVAEMASKLARFHACQRAGHSVPESEPASVAPAAAPAGSGEDVVGAVLAVLAARHGQAFAGYERHAVRRRIAHRMQVGAVTSVADYLLRLQRDEVEAQALIRDLLASVTDFFRDPAHFAALAGHLANLVDGKGPTDTVRIWVVGCATGEEAYSLAMLLLESMGPPDRQPHLRIFASDRSPAAVRVGRAGVYPATIAADVSAARLERFFVVDQRGYRVSPALRECVLFSAHDVLRDAPFSKLDLVSCRNLLVTFDATTQARVLDTFHFALRLDGKLFVGALESVDPADPRFRAVDREHGIYRRQPIARNAAAGSLDGRPWAHAALPPVDAHALESTPVLPGPAAERGPLLYATGADDASRMNGRTRIDDPSRLHDPSLINDPSRMSDPIRMSDSSRMSDVLGRLMKRQAPHSLVVDAEHEIIHLSEGAGRYLRHGGGESSNDLLQIVHPMLRIELHSALSRVAQTGQAAEITGLPVELDGQALTVDIGVAPADEFAPRALLVTFHEH